VHGIKGASFDLFAEYVGQKAAELEDAADAGDIGFIEDRNPAFLEAVLTLITDIEDILSDVNTEDQRPVKEKPDGELLSKLLAACMEYDIASVEEVMAEIEAYQYEKDGGLGIWLRENVDVMNYSQIAERLSESML
jgi:hypothetical protein